MKTLYYQKLSNAIKMMHARHGVGDVIEIRRYGDGRLEIDAKPYGLALHTRKGSIVQKPNNRTQIRLYGHTMTVCIVGGAE